MPARLVMDIEDVKLYECNYSSGCVAIVEAI